jgi:hypothetical protein
MIALTTRLRPEAGRPWFQRRDSQLAQLVEKDRTGKGMTAFAFVEASR